MSELTPSSLLEDYTCLYCDSFYKISSQLFPNTLPVMKVKNPFYYFSMCGCVLSLGLLFAYIIHPIIAILGVLLFLIFYALTCVAAKRPPASVEFGELKTFRDMVDYIADSEFQ